MTTSDPNSTITNGTIVGNDDTPIAHSVLQISKQGTNLYLPGLASSSLKGFYDDVVYWEIAKGTNKFFVTFERGEYSIQNNKQESIGTMEINYPHVSNSTASNNTGAFLSGSSRNNATFNAFLSEDEELDTSPINYNHQGYNGFIPITEIKGTRYWQTTITASISKTLTLKYEISSSNSAPINETRNVSASYFYPFSSHQLSVLRNSPTIIVDLDKNSELGEGYIGEKGFVALPRQTHKKIKDNLEYYLEKAGIIEKTTTTKSPKKGI